MIKAIEIRTHDPCCRQIMPVVVRTNGQDA